MIKESIILPLIINMKKDSIFENKLFFSMRDYNKISSSRFTTTFRGKEYSSIYYARKCRINNAVPLDRAIGLMKEEFLESFLENNFLLISLKKVAIGKVYINIKFAAISIEGA